MYYLFLVALLETHTARPAINRIVQQGLTCSLVPVLQHSLFVYKVFQYIYVFHWVTNGHKAIVDNLVFSSFLAKDFDCDGSRTLFLHRQEVNSKKHYYLPQNTYRSSVRYKSINVMLIFFYSIKQHCGFRSSKGWIPCISSEHPSVQFR